MSVKIVPNATTDDMVDVKHQSTTGLDTMQQEIETYWKEWLSYSLINRSFAPFEHPSFRWQLNTMKYNVGEYVYVHFGNIPHNALKSGKVVLGTHIFAARVKSFAMPHMNTYVNSMIVELMEPIPTGYLQSYNTQIVDLYCAFPDGWVKATPSILNTIQVPDIQLSSLMYHKI